MCVPKQPIVKFQDVDEINIAVDVPESIMAADLRSADIVQMTAEFSGAPGCSFQSKSARLLKPLIRRRRRFKSARP